MDVDVAIEIKGKGIEAIAKEALKAKAEAQKNGHQATQHPPVGGEFKTPGQTYEVGPPDFGEKEDKILKDGKIS